LLLLDVELPDGKSHNIAQSLRSTDEHAVLPIVFLTSSSRPSARLEALASGGDDFLQKPVDPELLLTALAGRVARAKSARSRMDRDGLTGLLNRAAFVERAEVVLSRLRRNADAQASLVVLDIDHFKSVNDQHGHTTGDRVLCGLAETCLATLRGSDLAGRLGGEEFALLLDGANAEQGRRIITRLLERFSKVEHPAGSSELPLRVTFSAGVAGFGESGGHLGEWLDVADRALYRAKRAGRNRVLTLNEPLPVTP
jgi:diguanylate cyclase (GGDEF)-like protein